MYNDVNRTIRSIRPASPGEKLTIGSSWIPILGYGEIKVKTQTPAPRNRQMIKLKNIIFIPSFFTSVVSLKKHLNGNIN